MEDQILTEKKYEDLANSMRGFADTLAEKIKAIIDAIGPALDTLAEDMADVINEMDYEDYNQISLRDQARVISLAIELRNMGYEVQELPPDKDN